MRGGWTCCAAVRVASSHPAVALVRLLIAYGDLDSVRAALAKLAGPMAKRTCSGAIERLPRLLAGNSKGSALVLHMLEQESALDRPDGQRGRGRALPASVRPAGADERGGERRPLLSGRTRPAGCGNARGRRAARSARRARAGTARSGHRLRDRPLRAGACRSGGRDHRDRHFAPECSRRRGSAAPGSRT